MDIHFCDLCGARVTEVDLRGGHGIRRQYDVICATCVELGHGKEWLAASQQRQQKRSATSSSQPAPAVASSVAVKASTAIADEITAQNIINTANDRAQTLEEGQESGSVAPQVLSAEAPEIDDVADVEALDADESDDGEADLEHSAGTLEADLTPESAPVLNNQFASAASSFSAMGKQSKRHSTDEDVDGENHGEGLNDESTSAPVLASDDTAASPFEFQDKASANDAQAQKDETLPSARDPILAEPSTQTSGRKSTSASASFKRSGKGGAGTKSSAANNARPSSSKSGKGASKNSQRSKNKNKNKNIIMLSAISVGILFMVGLIIMSSLSKPRGEQVINKIDLSENVKEAIKDARSAARFSLQSKELKALQEAKQKIQAVAPEIYTFAAEAEKQGWTDDEMGRYLDNVGWPDTNMMLRNINDEIIKQSKH